MNFPNFNHHNVFLRADLNVPLINGTIHDDFRLQQIIPTIDTIFQHNGTIILATHIGRPGGTYNASLSTKHLLPWFAQHHYNIVFEPNLDAVKKEYPPKTIVLLENLRFFPGEQKHDKAFAEKLAELASYYVNDAFATLHRHDTSISLLPLYFPEHKRFLGPLIKQELSVLSNLADNPAHPYVVIIGGGKVETKLELIAQLLDTADYIILMPALVFTFMKAQQQATGKSLVDLQATPLLKKLLGKTGPATAQLVYPSDYLIARGSLDGPLQVVSADAIPTDGIGISIGPKSLTSFKPILLQAKTIFFNAASGFPNRPETMLPLYELLTFIAQCPAFSVIAGGDSVAAAQQAGVANKVGYLSTGGGASLAYLGHKKLPGLEAFGFY